MLSMPDFKLSVGVPLTIETICEIIPDVDESKIIFLLKNAIRAHKSVYGVDVFTLQYQVKQDSLAVIPGPNIGRVNCELFSLTFTPKFEGLSVGKCLAFAHICKSLELVNYDGDIVDDEVSDDSLISSYDYFSKAFVASVFDIFHSGILDTRVSFRCMSSELKGDIDFNQTIGEASEFPIVSCQRPSIDLPVNQYLKKTLVDIVGAASSMELIGLAGQALNQFVDVSDVELDFDELDLNAATTMRRLDYEKSLSLAAIIRNGYNYEKGGEKSFSPYFTMNLDNLFEKLVGYFVKSQVSNINFDVLLQLEKLHPASPELKSKLIKPDLVLQPKDNSKYKNVVVDCKNKYSMLNDGALSIANADIYQMTYYAQCFYTEYAVLVYPGNFKNRTVYPIEGSEGRSSYIQKRNRAFDTILRNSYTCMSFNSHKIHLFFWKVDLTGTMKDTELSFAQLSLFLTDLSKNELI